jgi:hypothetical protein
MTLAGRTIINNSFVFMTKLAVANYEVVHLRWIAVPTSKKNTL